jgi:Zn-dependent alcohol dehydrogenase
MMRAAILAAPGEVAIRQVSCPEPGRCQVRLRLEGCGVCCVEPDAVEGPDWMTFPTSPGASAMRAGAIVDAVGDWVEGQALGTAWRRSPTGPKAI